MGSKSEIIRLNCADFAAYERSLVPEIAELTDAELWELRSRLWRAGFAEDGFPHPVTNAQRQGDSNAYLGTLQSAWQLAFYEHAFRQAQGC